MNGAKAESLSAVAKRPSCETRILAGIGLKWRREEWRSKVEKRCEAQK